MTRSTTTPFSEDHEWLEADGLGGFAMGTTAGLRTRRYHGLLTVAARPPADRFHLVSGLELLVDVGGATVALSSERFEGGVVAPDARASIVGFTIEPWPTYTHALPDGSRITVEVFVPHGRPAVVVRVERVGGEGAARLRSRPFLSGRDPHALMRENGGARAEAEFDDGCVVFRPYVGVLAVALSTNGRYRPAPTWYRSFTYDEERRRGLDHVEDLLAPGVVEHTLDAGPAVFVFSALELPGGRIAGASALALVDQLRRDERARRAAFGTPLARAADAYVVARGEGKTIIAGYPWFGDWGRDTFIAVRGLCLAQGRLDEAGDILLAWASAVSEGMLPNRFPDRGEAPEYNSVDASLWYVVAVGEYLAQRGGGLRDDERSRLVAAVLALVSGYARGTRHGIRADADGLLACGAPGVQLTWMDAKVGDWVVTPRIGKPVEIQALWIAALALAATLDPTWAAAEARARTAFAARFTPGEDGSLPDVVDVDHVPGTEDRAVRPNQIYAVGGLPTSLLTGEDAARVVAAVEEALLTPLGPRSLAPSEPAYVCHYEGGVRERDGAYHQGTVWPFLMGPFVEAWLRVRGFGPDAKAEARRRFVAPLLEHLDDAGLGHVSEIADADAPHTPRGCPFQAWSLGELLRVLRMVDWADVRRSQLPPGPGALDARPGTWRSPSSGSPRG